MHLFGKKIASYSLFIMSVLRLLQKSKQPEPNETLV